MYAVSSTVLICGNSCPSFTNNCLGCLFFASWMFLGFLSGINSLVAFVVAEFDDCTKTRALDIWFLQQK